MKVVIAIDGSQQSIAAAQFLRRLSTSQNMSVTALSVVQLPDVAMTFSDDLLYVGFIEDQEKIAVSNFDKVKACFAGTSVAIEHVMIRGHAGYEIVNFAEEAKTDLIILGSKGHSTLDRVFLGSVSDYVATHSHCSTLIARPALSVKTDADPLRVLLAYDGSAPAELAVKQFDQFKWQPNVHVELLVAVPVYHVRQHSLLPVTVEIDSKKKIEATESAERTLKQLRTKYPDCNSHVVEAEHVGQKIVEMAKEGNFDLVMVGDTGRSAIARMLLGSVSRYVVHHASQSVWVARQRKG
jgi:nucleotide-binding universal stress UspA family protein